MKNKVQKQYNDISELYDLLSEGDDGFLYFKHEAEKLLRDLPKTSRLIDCACGTGKHAVWMAKLGFNVSASDISEGMLKTAQANAKLDNQDIHFIHASWEKLPEKTNQKFNLAFIPGNSLSHITSLEMLERSLSAIKKTLRPDGKLFFDMRNWEKTFEEDLLTAQSFTINRNKIRYKVGYDWDIRGWNTLGTMIVDVQSSRQETKQQYLFDFFPFGYQQLCEALLQSGFIQIERKDSPDDDYYFVSAECRMPNA